MFPGIAQASDICVRNAYKGDKNVKDSCKHLITCSEWLFKFSTASSLKIAIKSMTHARAYLS